MQPAEVVMNIVQGYKLARDQTWNVKMNFLQVPSLVNKQPFGQISLLSVVVKPASSLLIIEGDSNRDTCLVLYYVPQLGSRLAKVLRLYQLVNVEYPKQKKEKKKNR